MHCTYLYYPNLPVPQRLNDECTVQEYIPESLISHKFFFRDHLQLCVLKSDLSLRNPCWLQNFLQCLSHLQGKISEQCLHFLFDKDCAENLSWYFIATLG